MHIFLFILIFITGCSKPDVIQSTRSINRSSFKDLEKAGELLILTLNSPTTYYEDREGELAGFEHDLAASFADSLGLRAEFRIYHSIHELLEAAQSGIGDLIAAGLTITPARQELFTFGPAYKKISEDVICRPRINVRSVAELQNFNIITISQSSYIEQLEVLKKEYPELTWQVTSDLTTGEIFQKLATEDEYDCTIADSNISAIHRRYFPQLKIPFNLDSEKELAWILPEGRQFLLPALEKWFKDSKQKRKIENLLETYYGFVSQYDPYDIQVFYKRIDERLPKFRKMFEEAAEMYGFSWLFLAAVSYQESHWDPLATSPTGVRGMMMLTRRTAEAMGVTDRLDPKQSIFGGARYLRKMINRQPNFIPENESRWMALASYNVGYSHLRDARSLTVLKEKNPNIWNDVRSVLPLLAQPRYHRHLRHGFARGLEPVIFVDRIRNYQDLLDKRLNALE